jgi:isopenicillin-N epimerase
MQTLETPPAPSPWRALWTLDPDVVFLNHGSFGACPLAVLQKQQEIRDRIEREPVDFYLRRLEPLLDQARASLAAFLGAAPEHLVFVSNATAGVNSVLRSLRFSPGDELLTTDHRYNACKNALLFVAGLSGARVVEAQVPVPVPGPERVVEAVMACVTPRTRLALLDHVTSPTGMIFPIERLIRELEARGVETLVDGAHAPGMLPLSLDQLGATYYTGNCHKWLCAPKGAGFLYVRPDRQSFIRPLSISHGANARRSDRSRFHLEFDWTGTDDPSAWLCVPESLQFLETLLPGGWPELMEHNHRLAVTARQTLSAALGTDPLCPEDMLGSLAAVSLPDGSPEPLASALYADPLHDQLFDRFHIEVPVAPWPAPPKRLLRVSAQIYNAPAEYELLASALRALL